MQKASSGTATSASPNPNADRISVAIKTMDKTYREVTFIRWFIDGYERKRFQGVRNLLIRQIHEKQPSLTKDRGRNVTLAVYRRHHSGCFVSHDPEEKSTTFDSCSEVAMQRRVLLFALFLSTSLSFTASLSAKDKPKTAPSNKIAQDFSKFVEIPGAQMAGEEQCVACHADLSKAYRRSAHSMQEIACEQCHGAGSLHVAAGGYSTETKDKIISFREIGRASCREKG